jgi:tRNA(fMet)-specific endonuclease VapC
MKLGNSYLVDTNVLISCINGDKSTANKFYTNSNVYISCVSLGELYYGAYKSSQKEKNLKSINTLIKHKRICEISVSTSNIFGQIKTELKKIGKPIPDNDIWIAAIAQENDLIIATRDKHFLELDFVKTERW